MYKTIAKIAKHIACVQEAMMLVIDELRNRALVHDASKFGEDELKGYLRFEEMPEGLKYGSPEYQEAMAKVMEGTDCFKLHSIRHDHHPEYYDCPEQGVDLGMMGVFPLMEMVSDWAGAHKSYGNKGGWRESVEHNIEKHNFSDNQKWVIRQMADFFSRKIPELRDELNTTADPNGSEKPQLTPTSPRHPTL